MRARLERGAIRSSLACALAHPMTRAIGIISPRPLCTSSCIGLGIRFDCR